MVTVAESPLCAMITPFTERSPASVRRTLSPISAVFEETSCAKAMCKGDAIRILCRGSRGLLGRIRESVNSGRDQAANVIRRDSDGLQVRSGINCDRADVAMRGDGRSPAMSCVVHDCAASGVAEFDK